jgi:hypothetical protein
VKKYRVHWRKVNSTSNSICRSAKLSDLDWSNWWTDELKGWTTHLHVMDQDGESIHRVRHTCRSYIRLGMRNGELCWLED